MLLRSQCLRTPMLLRFLEEKSFFPNNISLVHYDFSAPWWLLLLAEMLINFVVSFQCLFSSEVTLTKLPSFKSYLFDAFYMIMQITAAREQKPKFWRYIWWNTYVHPSMGVGASRAVGCAKMRTRCEVREVILLFLHHFCKVGGSYDQGQKASRQGFWLPRSRCSSRLSPDTSTSILSSRFSPLTRHGRPRPASSLPPCPRLTRAAAPAADAAEDLATHNCSQSSCSLVGTASRRDTLDNAEPLASAQEHLRLVVQVLVEVAVSMLLYTRRSSPLRRK
jgi:hypothetical protein